MCQSENDPEQIISTAIERHGQDDSARLAREIIDALWEAGLDILPARGVIAPMGNTDGPEPSPYGEEVERRAREMAPGDLFRWLAEEPRNAMIRDKIMEIARKFDQGA